MARIAMWCGRLLCVAGLGAWSWWLVWRIGWALGGVAGVVVLALEVAAWLAATLLTRGLWRRVPEQPSPTPPPDALLPDRLAWVLDLRVEPLEPHGTDDTGEVARARRGARMLRTTWRSGPKELAWAVAAVEGPRRLLFVAALVTVLLTGWFPFPLSSAPLLAVLAGAQCSLALGHWLLSRGVVRPGDRVRWSMASVGAGFGDGTSRSGLPVRWATTMATVIALNVAVALRGVSDRWTHGLGGLDHHERILAMSLSTWLVATGFLALQTLPHPVMVADRTARRVEEASTRRLALGGTLAVAAIGFVAGVLPGTAPL